MNRKKEKESSWAAIERDSFLYPPEKYPFVSVLVPSQNCAELIPLTIESIIQQDYPFFEIIVIDADSTDRTNEVVSSYRDERIRLYTVAAYHVNEMLNKGISLARGGYLNVLFPGDFYLSPHTLRTVMGFALNQLLPHLVYGASLLRQYEEELQIIYRPLDHHYLREGKQPTQLEACWFSVEVFGILGKFRTDLRLRGSYEFLCRFLRQGDLRYASIYQVLSDCEYRMTTRMMVYVHFVETMRILFRYYGFWATLRWFFSQKDLGRFFHLWLHRVRFALFGTR